MATELTWDVPGDGVWWATREHFPQPVSGLFAALFPPTTEGWDRSAATYGTSMGQARWAAVNGWMYYSPVDLDPAELPARAEAAASTLAEEPWRDEVRRWRDDERPAVVAANRSLQAEDVSGFDDVALADHVRRTIANFHRWAPLHFEHSSFGFAGGLLFRAARKWGLDAAAVAALLAGASPPESAEASLRIDRIRAALAGVSPHNLEDVRAAGPAAVAAALDDYLDEFGCRPFAGHDLAEPTPAERPELLLATLRSAGRPPAAAPDVEAVRTAVPDAERPRFDALLADARESYQLRDDDVGVCFNWPIGLVRRGVLEAGRRLVERGRLVAAEHIFEATPEEIDALLAGRGPSRQDLESRLERRRAAAAVMPPMQLGTPGEPAGVEVPADVARVDRIVQATWGVNPARSDDPLHGIGIGSEVGRGRACVVVDPSDLFKLEPGDVLITATTTAAFNAVFPLLAAVATEEGGLLDHTAILAREVSLPAVVSVRDLLASVHDGDLVEVDPVAGVVRVLS